VTAAKPSRFCYCSLVSVLLFTDLFLCSGCRLLNRSLSLILPTKTNLLLLPQVLRRMYGNYYRLSALSLDGAGIRAGLKETSRFPLVLFSSCLLGRLAMRRVYGIGLGGMGGLGWDLLNLSLSGTLLVNGDGWGGWMYLYRDQSMI